MILLAIFYGLVALHGFFLSHLLLRGGRSRGAANRYLGGLLIVASILFTNETVEVTRQFLAAPHLLGVVWPLWYLVPPLMLLSIRRLFGVPRRRWERLLVVPSLVSIAIYLPFYLLPAAEKVAPGALLAVVGGRVGHFVLVGMYFALDLFCFTLAFRHARAGEVRFLATRSSPDPRGLAWVRVSLLVGVVLTSLDAVRLFGFDDAVRALLPTLAAIQGFALAGVIYAVAWVVVRQPEQLFEGVLATVTIPLGGGRERTARGASLVVEPWERETPPVVEPEGPGAVSPAIPAGAPGEPPRRWLIAIEEAMTRQRLFLREDLRLDDLATVAGLTRHQVSQALNEGLGTTFYDYVNGLRVEEAKRRLAVGDPSLRMIDLAYEVGFGSAASFYRAFRKFTGTSPGSFEAASRPELPASAGSEARGKRALTDAGR